MIQICYICGDEFVHDTIWTTCGASCEREYRIRLEEEEE